MSVHCVSDIINGNSGALPVKDREVAQVVADAANKVREIANEQGFKSANYNNFSYLSRELHTCAGIWSDRPDHPWYKEARSELLEAGKNIVAKRYDAALLAIETVQRYYHRKQ